VCPVNECFNCFTYKHSSSINARQNQTMTLFKMHSCTIIQRSTVNDLRSSWIPVRSQDHRGTSWPRITRTSISSASCEGSSSEGRGLSVCVCVMTERGDCICWKCLTVSKQLLLSGASGSQFNPFTLIYYNMNRWPWQWSTTSLGFHTNPSRPVGHHSHTHLL